MAATKGHRIGEMLLDEEIITQDQLKECLQEQKVTGEKVGQVLVRKGYVSLEVLMAFLGTQMGVPYISLAEMQKIPAALVKLLPEQLMRTQNVIPVEKKGNTLILATADPSNVFVTDDIKMTTKCDLELRLSSEKEIKAALDKYFGFKEEDTGELVKASSSDDTFGSPLPGVSARPAAQAAPMAAPAAAPVYAAARTPEPAAEPMVSIPTLNATGGGGDTPVINFLTSVLVEANKVGATDIHFEPYEKNFRIRWRLDGVLQEVQSPPRSLASALAAKLKVMAEIDPKEKGLSQQGRMKLKIPGKDVTMSIVIAPTLFGEKVVMHVMSSEVGALEVDKLGMEPQQLEIYRRLLQLPYGMILLIGPKGSGKSVTAYATLSALNRPTKNVSAVDEPMDFYFSGINQLVVNERRGVTYAQGVRAMLDQDSDVLLVGEIRDVETARLTLEAVPAGHMMISTLHSNDPVAAIQSLTNMGLEPYLLGSSITAIVNQRLVRVICPKCKESYEAPSEISKYLGASGKAVLYRGKGCDACSKTGYKGQQAVYEILPFTDTLREAVINRSPSVVLKKTVAEIGGSLSLRALAAKKVLSGITSYEELLRVAL